MGRGPWWWLCMLMMIGALSAGCGNGDSPDDDRDVGTEDADGDDADGDDPDGEDGDVPDGEEPDGDVPDGDLRLEIDPVESPITFEGEETEVSITFSCEPGGCETTCQLNELEAEPCASPYVVTVNSGEHEVVIRGSFEGDDVEERVSFRAVQVLGVEVIGAEGGDVFRTALGDVSARCP